MPDRRGPPRPTARKGQEPQEAAPSVDSRQEIGALVAGKYRLVQRLARGGMGSVWEAQDETLERAVAIKFMAPAIASEPSLRTRFNREAKAAARLRTPHVVQVYEHGVDDDTPFIVMELLEGEDLHTRLRRERVIGLEDAARILAQVAKGLRAAHDAGIIHRDLKPHNVFLSREDNDLVVKILDFGVAKMTDSPGEGTKTGAVLGSPHYMSPEQARGLPNVDHRSDVWSLAVIAFRMVTGRMAFKGEATGDVIVKICTAPIPIPSDVNPRLPPAIDAFFATALEREPNDRFPTAVALASAFADAVRSASDATLLTPPTGDPLRPLLRESLPPSSEPLATPAGGTPISQIDHTPVSLQSMAGLAGSVRPSGMASLVVQPDDGRKRRIAIVGGVVGAAALFTLVALVAFGDGDETVAPSQAREAISAPPVLTAPADTATAETTTTSAAPAASVTTTTTSVTPAATTTTTTKKALPPVQVVRPKPKPKDEWGY